MCSVCVYQHTSDMFPSNHSQFIFYAGHHRHWQVQLLHEVWIPRAAQSRGQPYQLCSVSDIQQLHFCVSVSQEKVWINCHTSVPMLPYSVFLYPCSPSICHSDSDLSEGSRKYSPSSETSVETQRACGKRDVIIKHRHLHTCIPTHTHTEGQGQMHATWRSQEDTGSHTSQMVFQMFFLSCSATQTKEW